MKLTIKDMERRLQMKQALLHKEWVKKVPRLQQELKNEIASLKRKIREQKQRVAQRKGEVATKERVGKVLMRMR